VDGNASTRRPTLNPVEVVNNLSTVDPLESTVPLSSGWPLSPVSLGSARSTRASRDTNLRTTLVSPSLDRHPPPPPRQLRPLLPNDPPLPMLTSVTSFPEFPLHRGVQAYRKGSTHGLAQACQAAYQEPTTTIDERARFRTPPIQTRLFLILLNDNLLYQTLPRRWITTTTIDATSSPSNSFT
jgi:hypothetical protein